MTGVASWFILPGLCLSGMREIGYTGRIEVHEIQTHQAAAVMHQPVIGICAVCRGVEWISELRVGG